MDEESMYNYSRVCSSTHAVNIKMCSYASLIFMNFLIMANACVFQTGVGSEVSL